MEAHQKSSFSGYTKSFTQENGGYTVLVPLQDPGLSKTLLPPAIRAAKRHDGKIILLNIIEIPYQLSPSEAEQFILERKSLLLYALQIIETAGCKGEIIIRIAHRLPHASEKLVISVDIDLTIIGTKKKGLFWNKEISQKWYNIESNLLVAKNNTDSHFDEVILTIDDLRTASSMMEYATYLLRSKEGAIHIIPGYSTKNEQSALNKLRSIIDAFHRQTSWFTGKIIINQLQPKSATSKYLKNMYHEKTGSTCILVFSYPSGKKSKADAWLENEAAELNLPVFLYKVGRAEPIGIDRLTNQLKKWMGITS